MEAIDRMLAECRADRDWYHGRAVQTKVEGYRIDAAACAIREKALLDAKQAIEAERR